MKAGEGRNYSSTYDGEVSYLSNWVTARYNHLKKAYGDVPLVRYQGHAQSFSWLPKVNNGQIGGTVNAAKWLEAVNFTVSGASVSGGIRPTVTWPASAGRAGTAPRSGPRAGVWRSRPSSCA